MAEICDCHLHSFSKAPEQGTGTYTPPARDIHDYMQEAAPLGISRAVIVQASIDGTDNTRLIEALQASGPMALRGVGMIDPQTADLGALHSAGLRAIRVQDRARLGQSALGRLTEFAECAASVGWHLELNTEPTSFSGLADVLPRLPDSIRLVLDHIGHVDPDAPDALFRLMDTGRVWVKLSPTRVSRDIGRYADLGDLVSRIGTSYPSQTVWGSDWPHVMTPEPVPEIPPMLALCREALSSDQFRQCMWTNPEILYGF